MTPPAEKYFLLFFLISVLGWCMEVACKFVQFPRFINRGFLIGPYCPIYGVGAVLIILLLTRFRQEPVVVFFMAMLLCGTLEYLTSYIMEKLFHARWWDYSSRPFNIDGRVCLGTLIPFGLLGLLLIYVIKPFLFGLFSRLPAALIHWLCAVLFLVMLGDAILSATILGRIRKSATQTKGIDDTESLTRSVREHLSRQGYLVRRPLRAFPYMKLYNSEVLQAMRMRQQKIRRDAQERTARLREDFEIFERKLHDRKGPAK